MGRSVSFSPAPQLLMLLLVVTSRLTVAAPPPGDSASGGGDKLLAKGCAHKYSMQCLKLDVATLVDKLSGVEQVSVLPGVAVVKDNSSSSSGGQQQQQQQEDVAASVARDFPHDPDARVDAFLARRVARYLETHSLSVKLLDKESLATARKIGEDFFGYGGSSSEGTGRDGGKGGGGGGFGGGGGKKGGGGQLIMMMMMMKAMMAAGAGGLLAMLAGKALVTGLIALLLSALVALKSLAGGGGSKAVTYEIVSKPVYSHEHSHSHEVQHGHGGGGGGYGHSSYGRSFSVEPQEAINKSAEQYGGAGAPYYPQQQQQQQGVGGEAQGDAHAMAYSGYNSNGVDASRRVLTPGA